MSQRKPSFASAARRDDAAVQLGSLSNHKAFSLDQLPLDKVLLKTDGKDVVKKSSTRKGRYLLLFSAQVAPLSGGRLGTLAQLDTQNPVMYFEFPQGRLKMFGKLLFPKNKYMVLKAGSKDVLCEDVFDMMVVFSSVVWIGNKSENPEEKQLPLPADICHGNEPGQPSVFERPSPLGVTGRARSKSRSPRAAASEDEDDSDIAASVELGMQSRPTQPSQRSTGRRTVKRPRYVESSPSDDDVDEAEAASDSGPADTRAGKPAQSQSPSASSDADDGDPPTSKRQKPAAAKVAASRAKKRKTGADASSAAKVISLSSDSDDDGLPQPQPGRKRGTAAKGAGQQMTLNGAWTSAAKQSGPAASQPTPLSQRSLPGRAAKASAGQKLKSRLDETELNSANSESPSTSSEEDDCSSGGFD